MKQNTWLKNRWQHKTISKCHIVYNIIYIAFSKWHHYRDGEQIEELQGFGGGEKGGCD